MLLVSLALLLQSLDAGTAGTAAAGEAAVVENCILNPTACGFFLPLLLSQFPSCSSLFGHGGRCDGSTAVVVVVVGAVVVSLGAGAAATAAGAGAGNEDAVVVKFILMRFCLFF